MLEIKPDDSFFIEPGTALLILEAENLLASVPMEASPLRRNSDSRKRLIHWDTRKLNAHSEPCVFVALKTSRFDAHSHTEELLSQGHVVIAQDDALQELAHAQGTPEWYEAIKQHPCLIITTSSHKARDLLLYVVSALQQTEWTTLAITGTNGKTSTTQIASQMLEDLSQKSVLRIGTLGVQVAGVSAANHYPTMPDFPGLLSAFIHAGSLYDCRQTVMEATSIGLCENRMGLWQSQSAAFLNFSQDHLDYHGNMDAYFEAKLDLFRKHLTPHGHVVLNCTDPLWQRVMESAQRKSRFCIGFGTPVEKLNFFLIFLMENFPIVFIWSALTLKAPSMAFPAIGRCGTTDSAAQDLCSTRFHCLVMFNTKTCRRALLSWSVWVIQSSKFRQQRKAFAPLQEDLNPPSSQLQKKISPVC